MKSRTPTADELRALTDEDFLAVVEDGIIRTLESVKGGAN